MPRRAKPIYYRKDREAYYVRQQVGGRLIIRCLTPAEDAEYKRTVDGRRKRSDLEKQLYLEQLAREVLAGVTLTAPVTTGRLKDYLQQWKSQLTLRTPQAKQEYVGAVEKFCKFSGNIELKALKKSSSAKFISVCHEQGLSNNTIRSYLRMTSVYLNWLHEQGYAPAVKLLTPKEEERNPAIFTQQEMDLIENHLLASGQVQLYRAVLLMRWLGLRNAETRTLPLRHMTDRAIVLSEVKELGWTPKGQKHRVLPIPSVLQDFLREDLRRPSKEMYYLDEGNGQPAFRDSFYLSKALRAVLRELGIEGRKPCHSFRSSLATSLLDRGTPVHTTQAILRHANASTTLKHYAHKNQSKMLEALETLGTFTN